MSRFATLDSIKKAGEKKEAPRSEGGSSTGGDEGEEGEEGNSLYVGGTDGRGGGSGLSVIGPPGGEGGRGGSSDFVQGIFQRARGGPSDSGEAPPPPPPEGSAGMRTITMYRNGFTVNDGPFRALDDPANEPFLRDMARGIVPRELEEGVPPGQAVHVNLKDKREEEYSTPAAPSYVAYSGEGKSLAGEQKVQEGAVVSGDGSGGEVPDTDDSKPTTTLQIILHTGKKFTHKFNLSHTLRHVQAVIASQGGAGAPYRLLEGFPPRELTEFGRTLEEAGLKNARITQKLV